MQLTAERNERRDRDYGHRQREGDRIGLHLPNKFLKDTRYEYWTVEYLDLAAFQIRHRAFWGELVEDAANKSERDKNWNDDPNYQERYIRAREWAREWARA
eukprot:8184412-Heterocapsa_arctica.AAC.1